MTPRRRPLGAHDVDRSSEVYVKLRDLIVRGRLAPGARITETDAAERLGVSRTPVRAALQRLGQEGYIVVTNTGRRRRPMVAPLTREDATELLHILAEVEGLAARYAASLKPTLRTQLGTELRRLNEELRRVAQGKRTDANQVFDLDQTLHRRMVEAAAGSRLLSLHEAIKPQVERYGRVYAAALTDDIAHSVEEHAQLIQAIEAGDPDGAQHAVLTNWRNAAARLSHVIDAVGEQGSW
ncbi:MAG TPA: GntR family transcriptional regulator [Gemmatimonadales bacterium]|jgi:DNA-binding GntR family transcriptional regulator|nr:GntR family transcriptional regulator [Gemmatimonadales bacterium]